MQIYYKETDRSHTIQLSSTPISYQRDLVWPHPENYLVIVDIRIEEVYLHLAICWGGSILSCGAAQLEETHPKIKICALSRCWSKGLWQVLVYVWLVCISLLIHNLGNVLYESMESMVRLVKVCQRRHCRRHCRCLRRRCPRRHIHFIICQC